MDNIIDPSPKIRASLLSLLNVNKINTTKNKMSCIFTYVLYLRFSSLGNLLLFLSEIFNIKSAIKPVNRI